jgi:hypothetical protein
LKPQIDYPIETVEHREGDFDAVLLYSDVTVWKVDASKILELLVFMNQIKQIKRQILQVSVRLESSTTDCS